ncbi:helix-turn-helix domain-containing protein [Actinomadura rifamycini]|uniref:helix-turn-helix domain-containing protein n=1 Tax=Actinomadura rifamycini TaxID=31962 RepID=UPI000478AFF1|nr:helix-turn-helix transcriptional regulator [Actinomadura rifamycini]
MDDRQATQEFDTPDAAPAQPSASASLDPHVELGEFLRSRRGRLTPEAVGLPEFGRHRRVPGLRREELAQLAGVSVAYLTRLEQGRAHNASAEVLDALARALRLTATERTHLNHLARCRHHGGEAEAEEVRPGLRAMLAALDGTPAYVTGRRTDVLAWNAPAAALFGDFAGGNLARLVFLRPDPPFADPEAEAADAVGALRRDATCHPDDPRLAALVGELSLHSADFARLWARHHVEERAHGTRRLRHPLVGGLDLAFETFRLPDGSEQTLTVHHAPPGSAAADHLRFLASWGGGAS